MKKIIHTNNAPKPIGPYNQSVQFGNLLFTSGQIALTNDGEIINSNIKEETHQVFRNLIAILKSADLSLEDVIKVSIFLKDMDQFEEVNEVYASYFTEETAPARETVQVVRLPKDVNIEISLIAGKQ